MKPTEHEILTLSEAAEYLRVPVEVLRRVAENRGIPAQRLGDDWRFLKSALQDWLKGESDHPAEWWRIPPWHLAPSLEELTTEIERRLHAKSNGSEKPAPMGNIQQVLKVVGAWKDDPNVDQMLAEIYKRRGRPMTEEE